MHRVRAVGREDLVQRRTRNETAMGVGGVEARWEFWMMLPHQVPDDRVSVNRCGTRLLSGDAA